MPTTASAKQFARDTFARLPLRFEAQATESGEQYLARTDKWNVRLTATEAALVWQADSGVKSSSHSAPSPTVTLRMQVVGANPRARLTGENRLPTQINYFLGNDAKQWRTNVPNYAHVKATDIYPGIDAVYYGNGRQLEYDFNVAPQADAGTIRLRFAGARSVHIDKSGDLVIETSGGDVRQHQPLAYQTVNGSRREVSAHFISKGRGEVGFALGAYDHSLPLVIDPIIDWATILADGNFAISMALDAAGNVYLTGSVFVSVADSLPDRLSANQGRHPAANFRRQAANATQDSGHGGQAFVAKIDSTGSSLIYLIYVGGKTAARSTGNGIAVDAEGSAYIAGDTGALDFPVTPGAFQTNAHPTGSEAFVVKVNPAGTGLTYATYLGGDGNDGAEAIALDATGNAYVTGFTLSSNFPLKNPFQATFLGGSCADIPLIFCSDGFVTKLNADGSGLIYSSYIGGSGGDQPNAIAVDATGGAFITGTTSSLDLPVSPNAFQPTSHANGLSTGFVLKVNPAGSGLDYLTYLGGSSQDAPADIAIDAAGSAYIAGNTSSTDFPVTAQALQTENPSRSLFRSTNGGGNWQVHGQGYPSFGLTDIVIDPLTPSTLYAATQVGVYKSTDGGAAWQVTAENNSFITALAIDPKNPATLYAAIPAILNRTLIRSTDGGESWSFLNLPSNLHIIATDHIVVDPQNPATLYVALQVVNSSNDSVEEILKSTDGGQTWARADKGLPSKLFLSSYLVIAPSQPETLYFGAGDLYRTVNGGLKWKPIAAPAPISSLAVSSTDANVVYGATGLGLFKSVNGGKKWRELTGLTAPSIDKVWLDPTNPSTVYAGGPGLFKSTDAGATWTPINTGLPDSQINVLAIDPKNPALLYAVNSNTSVANGFITRLNADGSGLIFSTYLGARVSAITLDDAGDAYVVGSSSSPDFPLKDSLQSGPHQPQSFDTVVVKLDPTGTSLLYSTFVGVFGGRDIARDVAGNIYILADGSLPPALGPVIPRIFGSTGDLSSIVVKLTEGGGVPAPQITAINPVTGVVTDRTPVTISGSGFQPGAQVYFNASQANDVQVINSTTIQALTPAFTMRSI